MLTTFPEISESAYQLLSLMLLAVVSDEYVLNLLVEKSSIIGMSMVSNM